VVRAVSSPALLWRSIRLATVLGLAGCEAVLGLDGLGGRTPESDASSDSAVQDLDASDATRDAASEPQPEGQAAADASEDTSVTPEGSVVGDATGTDAAGSDAVGPDAGIGPTAALFLSANTTTTPVRGMPSSVTPYACPENEVVVGFRGTTNTTNGLVSSLQLVCANVFVGGPGGDQIELSAGTTLAPQGAYGSSPVAATCPNGQVVVGEHGHSGLFVDQLGFECAPLTITSSGSIGVDTTMVTSLPSYGGAGGGAFDDPCPAGEVARGVDISAGAWVDSLDLRCSTPMLVPCTNDLSNAGNGDFHAWFQVSTDQAGPYGLMNQRTACLFGDFWDIRSIGGNLRIETDDNVHYSLLNTRGVIINDGQLHHVLVERVSGTLSAFIDETAVGSTSSQASFGALPPFQFGTDANGCGLVLGPFPGTLSGVCVTRR
jgi:hypothetical protein